MEWLIKYLYQEARKARSKINQGEKEGWFEKDIAFYRGVSFAMRAVAKMLKQQNLQ